MIVHFLVMVFSSDAVTSFFVAATVSATTAEAAVASAASVEGSTAFAAEDATNSLCFVSITAGLASTFVGMTNPVVLYFRTTAPPKC